MNKLQAFATLIRKPDRLKALLSYGHKGYLASIGWFQAFDRQQAVAANGDPIPWVTYAFIDFVTPRLLPQLRIFEYGSGSSTMFYAKRVKSVISVEHDRAWYEKIKDSKPANAELIYCDLQPNGAYAQQAATLNQPFDLIIVDGRDRVNCCRYALKALSPQGVLILDDSERDLYQPARDLMRDAGFRELSFSGISPGLFYRKATSVFYRSDNCLAI